MVKIILGDIHSEDNGGQYLARGFQRAQCPLDLLMCPLANTTEAKCALGKLLKVAILQSSA